MTTITTPAARDGELADAIRAYLARLDPTPRNLTSAVIALARIDELGWAPLDGYPGSDAHWLVHCLACGWQGPRFYSHLRRARPLKRHPGCTPNSEHSRLLAALAAYATDTCNCRTVHGTTVKEVAELFGTIAAAWRSDDRPGLLTGLERLLGPCPATAVRAAAVIEFTTHGAAPQ
ncbi:hypothetical protein AB0I10_12590 [Streptomyces sp. NPDC050636]|uniref:hypothetical protein n=1 Tax=Streptomyces sp. NPDC050636 TaxID=3154510 RepID=UPI00342379E0